MGMKITSLGRRSSIRFTNRIHNCKDLLLFFLIMVRSVTPELDPSGGFSMPLTPRLSTVFAAAPRSAAPPVPRLCLCSSPGALRCPTDRPTGLPARLRHTRSPPLRTIRCFHLVPRQSLRSGFYPSVPSSERSSLATLPKTVPLTLLSPTLAVLLHGISHRNNGMSIWFYRSPSTAKT